MTEQTGSLLAPEILAEVVARPDDDEPRLRYADALEGAGQLERAEFIRAQCALDQMPDQGRGTELDRRARSLLNGRWHDWCPGAEYPWAVDFRQSDSSEIHRPGVARGGRESYRRGFAEAITIKVGARVRWKELLAASPLREIAFVGESALGDAVTFLSHHERARFKRMVINSTALKPDMFVYKELLTLLSPGQPALSCLESLELSGTIFWTGDSVSRSVEKMPGALAATTLFSALRSLALGPSATTSPEGCGLDGAGLATLLAGSWLAGLSELALRGNDGYRPDADECAAAIAGSKIARSLRRLEMRGVDMTKAGARLLAQGGPYEQLAELDLGFNKLGKEGLTALAKSSQFAALDSLGLTQTGLNAASLKALAGGPLAPRLRRLDVSGNDKIDDEAVAALVVAGRLPALRRVECSDTSIRPAGYQLLRTRFAEVVGLDEASLERDASESAALMAKAATERTAPEVQPPASARITFKDPNLTLAVVEALRKSGRLPAFDKKEFYIVELGKKPGFKPPRDLDKRVLKHLLATPISGEMVLSVETLVWNDFDMETQCDVWSDWDGEDDTFVIRDLAGIEQLANLRQIRLDHGDAIEDWTPVARLPKLEEIDLQSGVVPGLIKDRDLVETLLRRGVKVLG